MTGLRKIGHLIVLHPLNQKDFYLGTLIAVISSEDFRGVAWFVYENHKYISTRHVKFQMHITPKPAPKQENYRKKVCITRYRLVLADFITDPFGFQVSSTAVLTVYPTKQSTFNCSCLRVLLLRRWTRSIRLFSVNFVWSPTY